MRLAPRIQNILKNAIFKSFGDVHVYLFGSRVDDSKKGGDIDLAVDVDLPHDEFRKKKIAFFTSLARINFDMKVDLVPYVPNDQLLFSEIQNNHVRLI